MDMSLIKIDFLDEMEQKDVVDLADLLNTYAEVGVSCDYFINKGVDVTYCEHSEQFTLTNPQGSLYRFAGAFGTTLLLMGAYYDGQVYTVACLLRVFKEGASRMLEERSDLAFWLCQISNASLVALLGEERFKEAKAELDKLGVYPYGLFNEDGAMKV